jgi:hypothetical protein
VNQWITFILASALTGSPAVLSLEDALARTAKSAGRFWNQFASVNCAETVRQEKLGKEGKALYRRESTFDYLIFMSLEGDDLSVEESRLLQREGGKSSNLPLLVTNGFSTLLLVFHPYYQGSFEFQKLENEEVNGRSLTRIGFRHLPGTRSTAAVRLRGRDYPLDLEGTAWIDAASGVVEKIEAHLASPLDDLNLRKFTSVVKYSPQVFPSAVEPEWLPEEAVIDVETARQHWRNTHRFQNYRRFSVKAESVVSQ